MDIAKPARLAVDQIEAFAISIQPPLNRNVSGAKRWSMGSIAVPISVSIVPVSVPIITISITAACRRNSGDDCTSRDVVQRDRNGPEFCPVYRREVNALNDQKIRGDI